jgi:hypothetical protein
VKYNEKLLKKNYKLFIFDCGDYLLEDLKNGNVINFRWSLEDLIYIIEVLVEVL